MSLQDEQAQQGQTFDRPQRILSADRLPSSADDAPAQDGKRAEEALRQSEERFRRLSEASFEGIAIHSNGKILDANPTLARMFGYELSEVIGMPALDFAAPESRDLVLQKMRSGHEEAFEAVGLRKDGSTFPGELRGKTIPYNGRIVGVAAIRDITERKRAEAQLAYQADLLASVNDAVISSDEQFVLRFWNRAAERIYGWKADEVLGRLGAEVLRSEFLGVERSQVTRTLAETGHFRGELIQHRRDGTPVYVEATTIALRDGGGQITGYVSINRDITRRKRAEEALASSEERLRILFESAPDAYYLNDLEGNLVDGNRAAEEMIGYKKDELIGKNVLSLGLLSPQQMPKAAAQLAENALGKPTPPTEYTLIRKDGNQLTVEIRSFPVNIKDQTLVLAIARDITERKRAEEALRESESRYRLLAENATDIIWTRDLNLRATYVSPSVTSMLGYSVEEAMAQTMEEVLTPASLAAAMKVLAEELAIEKMEQKDLSRSRTLEVEPYCKDGSTVWLEVRMTFLRDEDNRAVGILGVSRDISERKRAEEALRESEERFRELTDSISDVFFAMDRDLKYTYWNKASENLTGVSAKDAIGKSLYDIFPEAEGTEADRVYLEVLRTQQPQSFVNPYQLGGKDFFFEISAYPSKTGLSVFSKDITERKRAEEALQKAREELESRVERQVQRGNAYGLTFRELTVLHLVAAGESDKEIATVLGVSTPTASKHLANILKKMGAACRTEAGVRAIREELLD